MAQSGQDNSAQTTQVGARNKSVVEQTGGESIDLVQRGSDLTFDSQSIVMANNVKVTQTGVGATIKIITR